MVNIYSCLNASIDNINTTYEIYILIGDFLGIFTITRVFIMTKKEYWQKRNKQEDIKQHNAIIKEKRQEETQKQYKAITRQVFKSKNFTSNYKELQMKGNNIWKSQKHIIDKRSILANIVCMNEKEVEKLLSKLQSLVFAIERYNNGKNVEVWEKVALTHEEFVLIEVWNNYQTIVNDEKMSDYSKWQAKEVYVRKMIAICKNMMKDFNLQ